MEQRKIPRVGQRLRRGGDRGTIRFIGEVPPTTGIWLGVEWDEQSNGKHDGTHQGVRYFQCRNGAGTFLRASPNLVFGTSFLQSLHRKYVAGIDQFLEKPDQHTSYTRKTLADIDVETPNVTAVLRRAARLDRRKEVVLDGPMSSAVQQAGQSEGLVDSHSSHEDVSCAYDVQAGEAEEDIRKTCPCVQWLDLSRSLLPTWTEIGQITHELPRLETLLLQENRLISPLFDFKTDGDAFRHIKDLRIDKTMMTWSEACTVIAAMPHLHSLQFGYNELADFGEEHALSRPHTSLISLSLEGNNISNWREMMDALVKLPSLQKLIVSSNKLQAIPPPRHTGAKMANLREVSISNNALTSWSDFDHLDAWTSHGVQNLVVEQLSCPLFAEMEVRDVRPMLIARLPALRSLNHAAVQPAERRDAELFYLSSIVKETPEVSDEKRLAQHPHWLQLVERYGRPDGATPTQTETSKQTLRSKLLPIRVHLSNSPPVSSPPFILNPVPFASAGNEGHSTSSMVADLLSTTPLRLLLTTFARILNLRARGGVRAIDSVWALLSPQIDPSLATAVHLRSEMRPEEMAQDDVGTEERIAYHLESLERDLAAYNIGAQDELVVVLKPSTT